MKNIMQLLGAVIMLLIGNTAFSQSLPQPSPAASFTQTIGVTDITMNYSRPGVKGREIWGGLVPYNEVWRAGANASTKIEFSTDVQINGVDVKAGKYAMFIIPTENEWTFIISSFVDGWGVDGYTKESDVVRVTASVNASAMTENLMFSLDNLTDSSGVLTVNWEKVSVGFAISINTNKYAMENLDQMVKKADNSFSTYYQAANWYMKNGDFEKALELAIKSTNAKKKFWNLTVLSEAYAATGDKKTALKVAKEALRLGAQKLPVLTKFIVRRDYVEE